MTARPCDDPRSPQVRVLLADDQGMVRSALRAVVERHRDLTVVAEAEDGGQAVAAASAHRPDVVVMDVRMPGMTGVEATARIVGDWPHDTPAPRVLVLTTFDLDEYVHAALRAGASGFLLKNADPGQLADAIRTVAAGEAMLSPTVTRRLIQTFRTLPPALVPADGGGVPGSTARPAVADRPVAALTERELAVLLLIARGLSNGEIAAELHLSAATVRSRVTRLFARLGVVNRVQATLVAQDAGLLD